MKRDNSEEIRERDILFATGSTVTEIPYLLGIRELIGTIDLRLSEKRTETRTETDEKPLPLISRFRSRNTSLKTGTGSEQPRTKMDQGYTGLRR